ncbi:MAG: DUF952 domain-containing protein [Dehalococcoidia bacterium]|nr:DUF952 domain-containing protein [Dehalococcoidia bacterium]
MSDHTLHLVPAAYFRDGDRSAPYVPERFDDDGFIHCTDGADELAATASRRYRDDRRMYVALVIDKRRVRASIRYEDERRIYPHIHGPLNRDAIVAVIPVLRAADGAFLAPVLDHTADG